MDPLEARIARLRRRAWAWGEAHPGRGLDHLFVTLTYRPGVDWHPRHVSRFMDRVRRFLGPALAGYMWVAELQQRGAVHYHVILAVRPGARIRKPDLAGWWPHGMTQVRRSRDPTWAVAYARKYLQKARKAGAGLGGFPRGLRIFAVVWRVASARHRLRVLSLPAWLREAVGEVRPGAYPRRAPGGGWVYGGILYQSPWIWGGLHWTGPPSHK